MLIALPSIVDFTKRPGGAGIKGHSVGTDMWWKGNFRMTFAGLD